jgi:hypothetical protein
MTGFIEHLDTHTHKHVQTSVQSYVYNVNWSVAASND